MIQDIDQLMSAAVTEVFGTMLNLQVLAESPDAAHVNGEAHVAGIVGFIGEVNGVVYLYTGHNFARRITTGLLGIEDADIDGNEMVNDAMGEMANMVVGFLKSRLTDRGMDCVMSIPSVIRGNHFSIEPVSSAERRVYHFKCDNNQLIVEVMIRNGNNEPENNEA